MYLHFFRFQAMLLPLSLTQHSFTPVQVLCVAGVHWLAGLATFSERISSSQLVMEERWLSSITFTISRTLISVDMILIYVLSVSSSHSKPLHLNHHPCCLSSQHSLTWRFQLKFLVHPECCWLAGRIFLCHCDGRKMAVVNHIRDFQDADRRRAALNKLTKEKREE